MGPCVLTNGKAKNRHFRKLTEKKLKKVGKGGTAMTENRTEISLKKRKTELLPGPAIPLVDVYPKKTLVEKIHTPQ